MSVHSRFSKLIRSRNDIIEYLLRSLDITYPNRAIDFFFVEDYGMNELANHESRPAVKKIEAEAMVFLMLSRI